MSKIRYEFGPSIKGTFPQPKIHGDLADPEVTAKVHKVLRAAGNLIDMQVSFTHPSHAAGSVNQLVEVHAVAYPASEVVPGDTGSALASSFPKGTADASTIATGGDLVVTVPGVAAGNLNIVTVLGYADTTPETPSEPVAKPIIDPIAVPVVSPISTG